MDQTRTRRPDERRARILDAARTLLRRHGTGVAIAQVAQEAGVSKSGLLHHFPSREALLHAVADDALARLQALVLAEVDLAENRPGKVLRAYVRVILGGGEDVQDVFEVAGLWSALHGVPGVDALLRADAQRWEELLTGDGLDPDRVLVVRAAAEGLAGAAPWDPTLTPARLDHARGVLLAMAEPGGALPG